MTEIIIGSTQSYLLPLESIDLTYLSKYVQAPREEKRPLWSKKCLDGESEYYKIQIVAQNIDKGDCYFEPSETYVCHICNLDVPIVCFKEHNESKKHETYKKIIEKVLERVSKQINVSAINNDRLNTDSVYYCEPCSKAIKLKNKYKHETSDYHTKSLEYINVLSDFYKICMRNENNGDKRNTLNVEGHLEHEDSVVTNNNSEYVKNYNNNLKLMANNALDSDDDFNTLSESDDDDIGFDLVTKNHTSVACSNYESSKSCIESKTEISFEAYLKEMVQKYKFALPRTDGDYIYIATPNGDKSKVSRENFHSYRQLKECIYCQICKVWNSQDTKLHDVSEIHVRNLFKPVDEHFGRMIDHVWSHCLICNEVVLTQSNHHVLNETHKKILNDVKITQGGQTNNILKDGKTYCKVCNVYIDTHNFLGHTNSNKHRNKQDNTFLEQNKITKISSNEYLCNICNLLLTSNNLNLHISSSDHASKKSVTISVQKSYEYCELCDVNVPKGGMEVHNAGNSHKAKVINNFCSELKNSVIAIANEMKAKNETQAGCGSTQKNYAPLTAFTNENINTRTSSVSNTSSDVTNVAKTEINKSADREKVDGYYLLLRYTDDAKSKVKCSICDVSVPYLERNIIEHMEGRNHIGIVNGYYNVMKYTDDTKTNVTCRICDVNVPFVQRNIIEHVKGKNHTKEQNELLIYHKIRRESQEYFCDCCGIRISNCFNHINSKEHTNQFQTKYSIDKSLLRKYVYEDIDDNNSEAIRYRELYNNLLSCNEIEKRNDGRLYCVICRIEFGRISEIDHMLGERHRSCKDL